MMGSMVGSIETNLLKWIKGVWGGVRPSERRMGKLFEVRLGSRSWRVGSFNLPEF